jgi:hypothetical protein
VNTLMFLVVAAATASSALLSAGWLRLWRERQQTESWRLCALQAGLEAVESHPNGVAARLGTLTVTIEARGVLGLWKTAVPSRASITFGWAAFQGLVAVARRPLQDGVVAQGVGDEEFDRRFDVKGSMALLRAVLDHRTRRGLLALLAVLRGELETLDPGDARHLATSGAELAGPGAAGPDDIAARLVENTTREPLAGVRAGNMRQLAEAFTDRAVTRELARTLIRDDDPCVRFEAARTLREEGRPTLIALTRDEAVTEDRALQALHELGDSLPRAEIRAGLERAMGLGRWQLAAAWKKRLGAVVDADDVRAMSAALTRWSRRLSREAVDAFDNRLRRLDAEIEGAAAPGSAEGYRDSHFTPYSTRELQSKRDQLLAGYGVPIAAALAATLRRAPASDGRDKALLEALSGPVRLAAAQGLVSNPKHLWRLWNMPELAAALGSLESADFPAAEEVLIAALAHADPAVLRTALRGTA